MNAHDPQERTRAARRIVITGFMAAGKTTVARVLSQLLGCASLDLDEFISEREGRTPRELIDEDGKAAFREAETRALREILKSGEARVIATGGGTWTLERNRALIAGRGCLTVWLDAPFELCWGRIQASDNSRPFARDKGEAHKFYQRRRSAYALAELHLRVMPGETAESLAEKIARVLV